MSATPYGLLAHLAEALAKTSKRREMIRLLAQFLQVLSADEIAPAVRLTIGQVFPEWDGRALNVSWRAVMAAAGRLTKSTPELLEQLSSRAADGGELVRLLLEQARHEPPCPPPITILEVFHAFEAVAEVAGKGSHIRKLELIQSLLERATPVEAEYLVKTIHQDMRHGVKEGIMLQGIAKAANADVHLIRRANQFWGDLGEVALTALTEGEDGLKAASVRLFRPLKPMLARSVKDLAEALDRFNGKAALEYKLDGARVQIHRQGDCIRIYSRNLADVTASLPDVAAEVRRSTAASECILEGEIIAVDAKAQPLPFQHLMRRFRRKHDVEATVAEVPVQLHLFDILCAKNRIWIDAPCQERWTALEGAVGDLSLVPRLVPETMEEAEAFARGARHAGHEGIMVKDLASAYSPGVRGRSWLKLKHVISLDLVIVAADWGYGRRHGWLSNYHLAALDEATGAYVVVGKTFKGLTDAGFKAMTERLLALEQSRDGGTVHVWPRVVVEVLFNELQQSKQYRSGLALRFARITRLREDKAPSEVNTLSTLHRMYEEQFQFKGRLP